MKKFLSAVLCILFIYTASAQRISKGKPNIIFILADDLGYGDIGCFGQRLIKTPHLDSMAKQGMKFTQFYSGATVCAPARSALLTGLHTGHTYIRGNKEVGEEGQWPIPDSVYTMAEMLKEAGYTTGNFGKWALGFVGTEGDPMRQGFDAFYGYNCQRQAHNYFPDHLWKNNQRIALPNTLTNQQAYSADLIHKQALAFIRDHKSEPFFAYLSYTLPHAALQLPAGDSLFEQYKKQLAEQPLPPAQKAWDGKGYEPQAYPKAAYAAMVGKLDAYVGEILAELRINNLDSNTVVVFASDNGPHREGGNDPVFFNSSGGLRGNKRSLYEGGIRTPFIAWAPGFIKAGATSNYQGAFWDFMPTFAELAGSRLKANTDGISLVPELKGQRSRPHAFLYWEFHEEGCRQAVRMGKWKSVRQQVCQNPGAGIELYDLEKDEKETTNIAAQYPEIVNKMKGIMATQHIENPEFPFVLR